MCTCMHDHQCMQLTYDIYFAFLFAPTSPHHPVTKWVYIKTPKGQKTNKKTCAYHSKFISHCKPRIVISVGMYEEYSNVFCSHSSLGQCWTICQKDISHSSNTLRSGPGKGKGLVRVGNYSSWTSRTISMLFSAFLYL